MKSLSAIGVGIGIDTGNAPRAGCSGARRSLRSLCTVALLIDMAACAGGAESPPPRSPDSTDDVPKALIAQRCTALAPPSGPIDKEKARVYVEVAQVVTPNLPRPIGDWLQQHPVEHHAVSSLLTTDGVPATIQWVECADAACASKTSSLTVTTHLPTRATEPIRLSIRIEPTSPGIPEPTTIESTDQQAVVLDGSATTSEDASLIVMPYLMRDIEDLETLMQCKREQKGRKGTTLSLRR